MSQDSQQPQVLPPPDQMDALSLNDEYMRLNKELLIANDLERRTNAGEELNQEELSFLKELPAKLRRAIDITRVLRRTNTGPAKVKTSTRKASKKAVEQKTIDDLMKL